MATIVNEPPPYVPPQFGIIDNIINVPYVELTKGGSGEAAFGGTGAASSCVRHYLCYFQDRYEFHRQVLGWPYINGFNGLTRRLPMQDPEFNWLWASRVSRSVPYGRQLGKKFLESGPFRNSQLAQVTVLFEQPPYDIMDDATLFRWGKDESYRFTEWRWDYSGEMLSKPSGQFTFAEAPVLGVAFAQTQGQFVPTNDFLLIWHDVPEVWALNSQNKLLNSNIRNGFGTVNNATWRDFPKGTVLLRGARTIPKSTALKPRDLGYLSFEEPRLVNVEFLMSYKDPPSENGTYFGWNLFPHEQLWYLATDNGNPTTGQGLFRYYDFTKLFKLA